MPPWSLSSLESLTVEWTKPGSVCYVSLPEGLREVRLLAPAGLESFNPYDFKEDNSLQSERELPARAVFITAFTVHSPARSPRPPAAQWPRSPTCAR